jgi:hypothetical protein
VENKMRNRFYFEKIYRCTNGMSRHVPLMQHGDRDCGSRQASSQARNKVRWQIRREWRGDLIVAADPRTIYTCALVFPAA